MKTIEQLASDYGLKHLAWLDFKKVAKQISPWDCSNREDADPATGNGGTPPCRLTPAAVAEWCATCRKWHKASRSAIPALRAAQAARRRLRYGINQRAKMITIEPGSVWECLLTCEMARVESASPFWVSIIYIAGNETGHRTGTRRKMHRNKFVNLFDAKHERREN